MSSPSRRARRAPGRPVERQAVCGIDVGEADAAAAGALGGVERRVGGAQELGGSLHAEAARRDAAGQAHGRPVAGQAFDRGLRRVLHGLEARALGQDAELVAAQPAHERPRQRLGRRAQRAGHGLERPVAAVVPADVVELLEVVDVAQQQRDLFAFGSLLERQAQALLERAPVGEAGQPVLQRELGHAPEQLGPADAGRDLAGDRVEQAQVVLVEVRLVGTAARPQLAPGDLAEHDRHGQARAPAEALEQDPLGLVQLGVVDDADVRAAFEQQPLERGVLCEPVDLVARVPLLTVGQHAHVDEGAQYLGPGLPARDGDRHRAERVARLLRGKVEQVEQRVRRRDRGRQRHQDLELATEALEHIRVGALPGQRELGLRGVGSVETRQQRRHHPRVELRAGAAFELRTRLGGRQRLAVGPVDPERVPGVAGQHDPRGQRDRLAREAVRIAVAVPALVRVPDRGRDRVEAGQRAQDALADRGMRVDERPLLLLEPARLVQQAVGDADLADPVQQRRRADVGDLRAVEAEAGRHGHGQPLDRVRVLAGVAVACLQRQRERAHHRVVGRGDALVLGLERLERGDERPLATLQAERGGGRLAAQVLQTA